MRRRCAVSAFFPPEEDRPPAGAREVVAAEASAVVTAFLARGFRTFFTLPAAAFGEGGVVVSAVIEPAEYALSAKKTQSRPFSEGAGRNPVYESGRLCFLSLFTVHCSL